MTTKDTLLSGCATGALDAKAACPCRACLAERDERDPDTGMPVGAMRMILCPTCGNKRCPHASDHRHACTGSNAEGQPGSVYQ